MAGPPLQNQTIDEQFEALRASVETIQAGSTMAGAWLAGAIAHLETARNFVALYEAAVSHDTALEAHEKQMAAARAEADQVVREKNEDLAARRRPRSASVEYVPLQAPTPEGDRA